MTKRQVTNPFKVKFVPFDNYGEIIPGMCWHKITYDQKTGTGTYVLKMEPGSRSLPHLHSNYEEFFMLDGELIDPDGAIFKKGDFVTFKPGSTHFSHTKSGCLVLVFMREINKKI